MNPVERSIRIVDGWQQRHRSVGFVFGVVKKFGDDRGPSLGALLAYYGFMALFPLLLVLTTVLGFIGNARLQGSVIATTLKQFPVYGQQIGKDAPHPLTGSVIGLVLGLCGLVYGSLGVAQAGQHAMAQVWNVPGVVRPGFLPRLARGLLVFVVLGVGMGFATGISGLATMDGHTFYFRLLFLAISSIFNIVLYFAVFRVFTPRHVDTHQLVPGAVIAGIGYSILLGVGTALVQHQLRHAQAVYGQYAFVLGLIAWLYLVAQLSLYAAELNVVRARRLWPRSIVQPPLTEADKRVLHDIARQEERRPEQRVGVGFEPDAERQAAVDAGKPAAR